MQQNIFTVTVIGAILGYAGMTLWLNAIRQTAALPFLWGLIILQLLLFLSVFVICSIRLRQCGRHSWWIWMPLLLSRVNDWEVFLIPATAAVVYILSELSKRRARRQYETLMLGN